MKTLVLNTLVLSIFAASLGADTLGFLEQKFSALNFEKGKWTRTAQASCYDYVAKEDGATVQVIRIGMGNVVPLQAKKGATVSVCGSVAAFDEGFETETKGQNNAAEK